MACVARKHINKPMLRKLSAQVHFIGGIEKSLLAKILSITKREAENATDLKSPMLYVLLCCNAMHIQSNKLSTLAAGACQDLRI